MSETTTRLQDIMAALPAASDAAGKSVVLTDANGAMSKMGIGSLRCKNLAGEESKGSVIDVKEFTSKYIKANDVGNIISELNYAHSGTWYLKINNLTIDIQTYMILVTKYTNPLNIAWATIGFVLIPTVNYNNNAVYFVEQTVGNSASEYSVSVRKIALTAV